MTFLMPIFTKANKPSQTGNLVTAVEGSLNAQIAIVMIN